MILNFSDILPISELNDIIDDSTYYWFPWEYSHSIGWRRRL